MKYYALPRKTHISEVSSPEDTSFLWLKETPEDIIKVTTEAETSSKFAANNFPKLITHPEIHTLFGFTNMPTVKYFDADTSEWEVVREKWILPYMVMPGELSIRQTYTSSISGGNLAIR